MSKENSEPDFWDVLDLADKQRYLFMMGAVVVFLAPWLGIRGIALIGLLSMFCSTRKPGHTSFMVFFQQWFKEKLFPQMSERLKMELDARSKQRDASLLSALKDSAQSFILSKTTSIRAELAWAAFEPTVRPGYRDFYAFRTASVSMGTAEHPVFAIFIGFNQEWYLSPTMKLDFDNVSVLRMLEGTQ